MKCYNGKFVRLRILSVCVKKYQHPFTARAVLENHGDWGCNGVELCLGATMATRTKSSIARVQLGGGSIQYLHTTSLHRCSGTSTQGTRSWCSMMTMTRGNGWKNVREVTQFTSKATDSLAKPCFRRCWCTRLSWLRHFVGNQTCPRCIQQV